MGEIAAIASVPADEVRPESRLLADLAFDALAFAQLAVLLFEHYEVTGSVMAFNGEGEETTVEMLFDEQILATRAFGSGAGRSG